MHRSQSKFGRRLWLPFIAAVLFAGTVSWVGGQEPARPERPMGAIFIGIDTVKAVQLSTKKKIKSGTIERPSIARFERDPKDATLARVTGVQAGLTRLELLDEDDVREIYELIVEPDLEYVRRLVNRKVPGSNVTIDAAGPGGVLVSGYVDSPENVHIIVELVKKALGGEVINNMRVIGVQQVQLCVVIAEVSRTKLRNMSFAWDETGQNHFIASALGLASNVAQTSSVLPGAAGGAAAASLVGSPGNLFLGLVNDKQAFWLFFQALKNESLLKLLAEPTLNCESGRQGSFLAGGEQAIPVPAGLGQVGVQFEEFGVRLNYVPTVLGDRRIRLELEPEVSALDAGFGTSINGTTVPGRTTQRVHTTVEMEAGQTYVIGGLIRHSVNASTSKVPIVGELPYLGVLFSSKSYSETEDELLVIVTPEFVDAMDCSQAPSVLPGQETRTPDDFELFLEGIMEAPRGQRTVCSGGHYNAAWKSSPTATTFPCAPARMPLPRRDPYSDGGCACQGSGCSTDGCRTGTCAGGTSTKGSGLPGGAGAPAPSKPTDPKPAGGKTVQLMPVPVPEDNAAEPMLPLPAGLRPNSDPVMKLPAVPAPRPVANDPPAPVFLPSVAPGAR